MIFVRKIDEDMARIWSDKLEYERYAATYCRVNALRKPALCPNCFQIVAPGATGWRPLTNGTKRGDRLCSTCVEQGAAQVTYQESLK